MNSPRRCTTSQKATCECCQQLPPCSLSCLQSTEPVPVPRLSKMTGRGSENNLLNTRRRIPSGSGGIRHWPPLRGFGITGLRGSHPCSGGGSTRLRSESGFMRVMSLDGGFLLEKEAQQRRSQKIQEPSTPARDLVKEAAEKIRQS